MRIRSVLGRPQKRPRSPGSVAPTGSASPRSRRARTTRASSADSRTQGQAGGTAGSWRAPRRTRQRAKGNPSASAATQAPAKGRARGAAGPARARACRATGRCRRQTVLCAATSRTVRPGPVPTSSTRASGGRSRNLTKARECLPEPAGLRLGLIRDISRTWPLPPLVHPSLPFDSSSKATPAQRAPTAQRVRPERRAAESKDAMLRLGRLRGPIRPRLDTNAIIPRYD